MPRRVDDNDDRDDDEDDRPRKRRRRSYDDDDDDEDDRPVRQKAPLTGLDHTFAKTDMVGLVIFGLCCGWVAVILSLVALLTCKDETAKRNAMIVLIIAGVVAVAHTIGALAANAAGAGGGF